MRFSLRIFLGFFLLLGLMALFVFDALRTEIRPAMRQAAEEVLVDTAQLLAELAQEELRGGALADGRLAAAVQRLSARDPGARIGDVDKREADLRVYVVDATGRVLYDSWNRDIGADYSQWRDVYLTLRGGYGARTTREVDDDPLSSWMYVAAPVTDGGHLVGVVSVGKRTGAIYPYVQRAESRLLRGGILTLLAALLLGGLFSWWLSRGIGRLTEYANSVRDGVRVQPPEFPVNRELTQLAAALDGMRRSLDGKEYIEEYVLGLTHELKSPLTGIRASAELLQDPLPDAERVRFAGHVQAEALRLQQIVDRLLELVRLEQRQQPVATDAVPVAALCEAVRAALAPQLAARGVTIDCRVDAGVAVRGEQFLLEQALRNLVQNAIDFAESDSAVRVWTSDTDGMVDLLVENRGAPVPDYALPRLFERFFSVPPAEGARKGTGLGLPLVRSIAMLHGGTAEVGNVPGGVRARLQLPRG